MVGIVARVYCMKTLHGFELGVLEALVLFLALGASAARSQEITPSGKITFEATIPRPPGRLPVLKLTPQGAPISVMNRVLAEAAGGARLTPLVDTPFFQKN